MGILPGQSNRPKPNIEKCPTAHTKKDQKWAFLLGRQGSPNSMMTNLIRTGTIFFAERCNRKILRASRLRMPLPSLLRTQSPAQMHLSRPGTRDFALPVPKLHIPEAPSRSPSPRLHARRSLSSEASCAAAQAHEEEKLASSFEILG